MLSVNVSEEKKRKMARLKVFQVCLLKRRSEANLENVKSCASDSAARLPLGGEMFGISIFSPTAAKSN